MPELPEVENTRRNLVRAGLPGCTITGANITWANTVKKPSAAELAAALRDRTIQDVQRRGKYLILPLSGGGPAAFIVHLGMTGSCRIVTAASPSVDHEHIIVYLDDGMTWRYRDPRRFGMFELHPIGKEDVIPECLAALGPEPLAAEFTAKYLRDVCRQRQKPIKNLVMDNACVVGIGNIYASEALYRARIHPGTPAARLSACAKLITPRSANLRELLNPVPRFG